MWEVLTMENVKRYYGADGNDKVLPWIFYRTIEAEHCYPEIEIVFELPGQSFNEHVVKV